MAYPGKHNKIMFACGITRDASFVMVEHFPTNVFPSLSFMVKDDCHKCGLRVKIETLYPLDAAIPAMTCPKLPPPQMQICCLSFNLNSAAL